MTVKESSYLRIHQFSADGPLECVYANPFGKLSKLSSSRRRVGESLKQPMLLKERSELMGPVAQPGFAETDRATGS